RKRRKSRAVNPVFPNPATDHADPVAFPNDLLLAGPARDRARQEAAGTTVDQGLAEIALVEDQRAIDGRDATLVAPVLDPAAHAVQDATGMKQPFRQLLRVIKRGHAEHVSVENGLGPQAAAQDVAIDAHDAGQRATVRIERRRTVMGLDLDAERVLIV